MLIGSAGAVVVGPLLLIHSAALFYLGWLIIPKNDYFWKSLSGLLTIIIWYRITPLILSNNESSTIVLVSLPYFLILFLILNRELNRKNKSLENDDINDDDH